MDSVRECLSCFDVQYRRLRSVRDRWPYQISQNKRANAEIAHNLEKTDLERESENYSAKEPYSASLDSTLDKKVLKWCKNEKVSCRFTTLFFCRLGPTTFLCKYKICMSFIKISYQIRDDKYGLRGPLQSINLISTSAPSATQDRRLV